MAACVLGTPGKETTAAAVALTDGEARAGVVSTPNGAFLEATRTDGGQYEIKQSGRPILRYNYKAIEPGEVLEKVAPDNRKYAGARGDYVHPLYGLDGEVLTRDWSVDHPHHRGIYWAWPEVDYKGERGDLHALQRVFARPTGKVTVSSGPVFAQIEAENVWLWEDREPIVRERAIIRAYASGPQGRCIDLTFQFTAVGEDVSLARRGTEHYGGLNIRLAPVQGQEIAFRTDARELKPRMAWAVLSGRFQGGTEPASIAVFQNAANPDYPGDWIKYPELNWFQPTFPAAGTRYVLKKGQPLLLQFRIWVRRGGQPPTALLASQWRAIHALPTISPSPSEKPQLKLGGNP